MKQIKAYVDGILYMEDEKECLVCGELTNRTDVATGERKCFGCGELVY
jgi:hypothetical protein